MVRLLFGFLLVVHALIHLIGFAKAFGLASLPQLAIPISRSMGLVWLGATALLLASAATLFVAPRWFWTMAVLGGAMSQLAIFASWGDARFGTIANVIVLVGAVYGSFAWGPMGLRAEYVRLTHLARVPTKQARLIAEEDLPSLPTLVQSYLRFTGVVGTPRPRGIRSRMRGRIRASASSPWMPFEAEQQNFFDPQKRYFFLTATRGGLPLDGLHAYGESGASMRIRLLSLFPIVSEQGADLTRGETVTVFNDMCIMAPGALLDASVQWKELDDRSVEATFTNGSNKVTSVLQFDTRGALVNFWSDDRPALSDGKLLPQRWSTPIRDYTAQGPYRLASRGEARYAAPTGEYAYIELEGIEVSVDPALTEQHP